MTEIRREGTVDPTLIPPLDTSLFTPTETEVAFLHTAISDNDEEMRRRVLEVQKEAYEKYPYPCIRAFHHVSLMMSANPAYSTVLQASKAGDTLFLDLGCCMGTDVRKFVYDGYPATNVLGCDLRQDYIDLGYKLYRDKDISAIHFFTSDIFDLPTTAGPGSTIHAGATSVPIGHVTELSQLTGSLTHVYTGALFHLFDESTQYAIAHRIALLLKRAPGAIVFGRHRGAANEGIMDDHLGRIRYGHSEKSWPLLWKRVFTEVEGTDFAESRVHVQAKLTEPFHQNVFGTVTQAQMLVWSVQIV